MKKLAKKLISFQSDKNHPKEIGNCFDFVVEYLRKNGLKVRTYSHGGYPSLVAARRLKKHYKYILNGHLDVVPADYDRAFEPYVKRGRLYGRGASDMKGTDAAMMRLMVDKELENVDMGLMLTSDEEIGGFNGVKYLLEEKKYKCDCVIIPDGGQNWQVILAEKGIIHIKITTRGKAAHGSRPWLGENAIDKLIGAYTQIRSKIKKTSKKNRWKYTLNLGKIEGGNATNKVPNMAEAWLDFRYPRKRDRKEILNIVNKACQKYKNCKYKVLVEGAILQNVKNCKYRNKLIKICGENDIRLEPVNEHGGSDGRFFSKMGVPVLLFKPKCSESHIDNEWIDLKSLQKFRKILKTFLLS